MANVTEVCEVKPIQAFLSTNLNNKNKTFKDLADKIMYQLGYPSVSIELQINQVYSAIQNAIEFFTKYAGYKEEFLLFDSRLYEKDKGIRLDKLCTIASSAACQESPGTNPALYKKHNFVNKVFNSDKFVDNGGAFKNIGCTNYQSIASLYNTECFDTTYSKNYFKKPFVNLRVPYIDTNSNKAMRKYKNNENIVV